VVTLQAFVATGTNIQLVFNPSTNGYSTADHGRECDFDKEHGKVSRTAHYFISIHTAMCQQPVVTPHSQLLSSSVHTVGTQNIADICFGTQGSIRSFRRSLSSSVT